MTMYEGHEYHDDNKEGAEIRKLAADLRAANERIEMRQRPTVPSRPRVEGTTYCFVASRGTR